MAPCLIVAQQRPSFLIAEENEGTFVAAFLNAEENESTFVAAVQISGL